MLGSLKKLFSGKIGSLKEQTSALPKIPEALGLRLGGSFTIDPMFLKVNEPYLIIENASASQIIQAVGVVKIDDQNRLLRFYTDDEGFLQVLQYGEDDAGISEISLWYFYDTKSIPESKWNETLKNEVVTNTGSYELEDLAFNKVWEDINPVPLVEKTYHLNGDISETTQFIMSYVRNFADTDIEGSEMLLISAEEKVNTQFNTVEHQLVRSTGVDIDRINIMTN